MPVPSPDAKGGGEHNSIEEIFPGIIPHLTEKSFRLYNFNFI
jgi:hypothetical protein